MRVALIDFKDMLSENDQKKIQSVMNPKLKEIIYFDIFSDSVDDAEYCLDIRMYDLIIINFRSENYNKYYNLFTILNKRYELKHKVFMFNNPSEERNLKSCLDRVKEVYKSVDINLLGSFFSKEELTKKIVDLTENYFLNIPIANNIKIDYDKQELSIITSNGDFKISVEKTTDFQVLNYFIRHYGEIININLILSAISNEPELMNNSPIESSISSIRKLFAAAGFDKKMNPITAFKRVGYRFCL